MLNPIDINSTFFLYDDNNFNSFQYADISSNFNSIGNETDSFKSKNDNCLQNTLTYKMYPNLGPNTNIIQQQQNNDTINNFVKNRQSNVYYDKFYNLTKDNEQNIFMDMENCFKYEEENQNIISMENKIYIPPDIKIEEKKESKKDNININILQTREKTLFKTIKQNDVKVTKNPDNIIHKEGDNKNIINIADYKYEKQKTIKKAISSLLKYARDKLNKLIRNSRQLPKKYKTRKKIIHPVSITSKASNRFNKKFWKMKFKRILFFGKNRIAKKNTIYNNYLNIRSIIKYIKDYQVKNNTLPLDLRKIKRLLHLKPLDLIKKFVKSKKFKLFKEKEHIEIDRIGIKREINIDIFTESGFICLLKPFEDNKSIELKKKNNNKRKYSAFRKCFHHRHVTNDN